MELDKKKYKQQEVKDILTACQTEYEAKLAEQKNRIFELTEEVLHLNSELARYKDKESYLASAIISAEKTAEKIKRKSELQYQLEMDKLRSFNNKWDGYFLELKEKYPMYAPTKKAIDLKAKLQSLLKLSDSKRAIEKLDKMLGDLPQFEKKGKDYVSATSDNGFNLDEVLNPGELELEELCKELGLLDEE